MTMKKIFKIWILVLIILIVTSLIISIWMPILDSLRIVFGSVYVLFLPGYFLTFLFFPKKEEEKIDSIERIALSFALSIAVVPLIIFYLNLIGMKINVLNTSITILVIIILTLILCIYRKNIISLFKHEKNA